MAGKPKLHYFNDRGRMETIRWLLAAAGVEFEEQFINSKADLEKLRNDGLLLFQQVPMVEIDGMKMVQTRAILNYIAGKYNLCGKDLKMCKNFDEATSRLIRSSFISCDAEAQREEEKVSCAEGKSRTLPWLRIIAKAFGVTPLPRIDMYCETTMDLSEMIMMLYFKPAETREKDKALMLERASTRYFPAFEKVLKDHGQDFLVGNKFSRADVQVLESILMVEEEDSDSLSKFPLLKAFKARISNIPTIKKFLQPGSLRKPPTDEKIAADVAKAYQ